MHLSWKNYLRYHAGVKELNLNPKALQSLFDDPDPSSCFRALTENRILSCLTRSPMSSEVQASFLHASEKESFQQKKPFSLALVGFGNRARAVRLNPELIFVRSTQKQKIPTFDSFMMCISIDTVTSLEAGNEKEKIDSFAILPPCLADEIFEDDSMEAQDVLWRFIQRIKSLRPNSAKEKAPEDNEDEEDDDVGNKSPISGEEEDEDTTVEEIPSPSDEKESFYKILVFLWAMMKDHKSISGTPLTLCNKRFTKKWEEQQHLAHLKQEEASQLPRSNAPSGNQGLGELTGQLEELNNNLTAKKLETSRDKEDEDGLGLKRFKKISKVHQNILKLFTLTEFHSDEDAESLEPAPGMLEMLACQGVYDAQGLIHNMLKRNGNVAFIQTGICTALMKGFITPIDPKMPSNLTPFGTYAALSSTSNLDTKALLKFAMKQNYERFDKEDLDLLTSMEITIPKTFHVFHHMLRNMQFLCQYLAGEDALVA